VATLRAILADARGAATSPVMGGLPPLGRGTAGGYAPPTESPGAREGMGELWSDAPLGVRRALVEEASRK
jgi:hypothetical protein